VLTLYILRNNVYLLTAVINNENLIDELITGWLDIGITGATVMETTDFIQLISTHIPPFAGFRSLTGGGMRHNKTIFTVVTEKALLDEAIGYLKALFEETGKSHQGVYFVTPLLTFGRLGCPPNSSDRLRDIEKKLAVRG
jgi:nitrogen regulatory protein P-II 1